MSELEINHVYKDYKLGNKSKFNALNDINISFEKGELVSIIGESGSGKSTLMNLIGGLDSDYTGEIKIGGIDLKTFKEKQLDDYRKKKIGFVFQSFNLIPHLSILDNVTIALTLSDVKESVKLEKAKTILAKLGLENQLKKKPTQLSGGQKQRVAIARALINDPDIILADEPTGSLDSMTTLQILDIMKEIADDGKLVIMVTHSEKVASISSRVVELSDGKIIRDEIKPDYQKNEHKDKLVEEKAEETTEEKGGNKPKKEKHLSVYSAVRLSLHNMWASRTKNFLMALGVTISLISMILMLAFGSGLTSYIDSLAQSYSNPTIVTVSKSTASEDNPIGAIMDLITPSPFTDEEITDVVNQINNHLDESQPDLEYRVDPNEIGYGFSTMTGMSNGGATIDFNVDGEDKSASIFYLYTTPPYYTEEQLLAGELSGGAKQDPETGEMIGEIMLSAKIASEMGLESYEDAIGKLVTVNVAYPLGDTTINISQKCKITAIVDVNMFEQMLVMYINYDYLVSLVEEQGGTLSPTAIYINTDSESTTNIINNFLSTTESYTGSVENQMASMFTEMLSTFSIALAIIAGISLIVAMIMILVVLYMSVSERTREIGVLKSIGARKRDIKKIFTTESFLIGLFSGLVGIVFAGVVGGLLVLLFNSILGFAPLSFHWYYFLLALGLSVVISVLAGLYPASKAAKLDPVESLRHE